jgi:hypothetical protein
MDKNIVLKKFRGVSIKILWNRSMGPVDWVHELSSRVYMTH